jgi:hypothetical protein
VDEVIEGVNFLCDQRQNIIRYDKGSPVWTTEYNFNGVQTERRFSFKAVSGLTFTRFLYQSNQYKVGLIQVPIQVLILLAPAVTQAVWFRQL